MPSSQMAELIRNTNWAETALGGVTSLAILAENLRADYSRFEISMFIWWRKHLVNIYQYL